MTTVAAEAKPSSAKEWSGGEVLFCGGTDWSQIGRSIGKNKKDAKEEVEREQLYPNLLEPHRIKAFMGVRIAFVAAGPAAVHCMAADTDGRLYTWGRNEKGQLGHGDQLQRNVPKVVAGLASKFVVAAAGGKHHGVVVTRDGESFAFGSNQVGQCGIGSIKKSAVKGFEDLQLSPVACLVSGATAVAAGADFTIWIAKGNKVLGAGNPQYGQLGDGSDHVFNAKDSSIQICYEPQPTPKGVKGPLSEKEVSRIACGHNHCLAVDTEGACYTWGFGGYGRLGHKVQQDEFMPRKVEEFKGRISVPADAILAAAGTASFSSTAPTGQMYSWGKLKAAGDNQMYPQIMMDLSGWNVRSMACGPAHFVVAADESVICWGSGANGELGYGATGKKSSANPAKCNPLEGMHVHQVAAGVGFSLFLANHDDKKLDKAPVFESSAAAEEAAAPAGDQGEAGGKGGKASGKRKAEPAAKPAAKGKKAK